MPLRRPRKLPTPPAKLRKTQALPQAKLHKPRVKHLSPLAKQAPTPQQKLPPPLVMPLPPLQTQPRLRVRLRRRQRRSRNRWLGRTLYKKNVLSTLGLTDIGR
jgi:hypothetical protein